MHPSSPEPSTMPSETPMPLPETPIEPFLEALQKVVTNWVKTTDEGKKWYAGTNEDANVGDLCADGIPDKIRGEFEAAGIFNLDIECISSDTACRSWTYDTHLVNEDLLEG